MVTRWYNIGSRRHRGDDLVKLLRNTTDKHKKDKKAENVPNGNKMAQQRREIPYRKGNGHKMVQHRPKIP